MANIGSYNIVKCVLERGCKKCNSIGHSIVIDRGIHCTMYCSKCGAYIKHASVEDKRHFYVTNVMVEDGTPLKVCSLYIESEKTMFR